MRFSENRVLAWVVLALAILFSVSFSGGGAMRDIRYATEQVFVSGARNDGLSISNDLDVLAQKAGVLVSIAKSYLPGGSDVVNKAEQAANALRESSGAASRFEAYAATTGAIEDVYTQLQNAPMSEKDRTDALKAYKEIESRTDTVNRNKNEYNTPASQFNQGLERFPASLVSKLARVEPLPLFE